MVHKRSKDKLLQRQIRRAIYMRSFTDRIVCETVNRVSREEVLPFLSQPVYLSDVPDVLKGEVFVLDAVENNFPNILLT